MNVLKVVVEVAQEVVHLVEPVAQIVVAKHVKVLAIMVVVMLVLMIVLVAVKMDVLVALDLVL